MIIIKMPQMNKAIDSLVLDQVPMVLDRGGHLITQVWIYEPNCNCYLKIKLRSKKPLGLITNNDANADVPCFCDRAVSVFALPCPFTRCLYSLFYFLQSTRSATIVSQFKVN